MKLISILTGIVNCSSCDWGDNLAIECSQTEIKIEIRNANPTDCPFNDDNYYKAYVSANEVDECLVGAVGHANLAGRTTDNLLGQPCISMGQSKPELIEIATNLFIRDETDELVMSMPITCQINTHIEYKTIDVQELVRNSFGIYYLRKITNQCQVHATNESIS